MDQHADVPVDAAAVRLAARQHGCLASWQLADVGLTRHHARSRRQRGMWIPLGPRVDLVGAAPATPQRAVMAAVLGLGPRAVASHDTALWLHQLRPDPPRVVHVTVPGTTRRRPAGVVVHTTRSPVEEDEDRVDAIPTTTVGRTLVDMAGNVPELELIELLDEVLASRRASLRQLREVVERLRRGRGGLRVLDAHLADDAVARFRSDLERRADRSWSQRGLPRPRWNVRVRDGYGAVWRVDALFVPWPVVVELDGLRWHSDARSFARDRRMDRGLLARGFTVLRFTWRDVVQEPDRVGREVAAAVGRAMVTGRRLEDLGVGQVEAGAADAPDPAGARRSQASGTTS